MPGLAAVEGAGSKHVLVLHGWALDSEVWSTTRPLTNLEQFTYAYFDFPGYGTHSSAPPAAGLDDMAAQALAAARGLGWDTFAVLGHSMGGATAMRVATLAPDDVTAVVALTPVAPTGMSLPQETYQSFVAAWDNPGPALAGLAPHLSEQQLNDIVSRCRASMNQSTWDAYLANWTGADFADAVSSFDAPTTLAYGVSDPLVTADYLADTVARLRNGRLVPLEGAGHFPMVERPEQTVRLWEEALGKGAAHA